MNNTFEITFLSWDHPNVYFKLSTPGFSGNFRIYFEDNTRKNAHYKSYSALTAYFEELVSDSVETCNGTDACIFVERKMQWILEKLIHENL